MFIRFPSAFVESFVAVAVGQIGNRETGKSNGGPVVRAFMSATWLGPVNTLWCAGFVCWCFLAACSRFPSLVSSRPTTPRAFEFESWAISNCVELIRSPGIFPRRGDIVVFRHSHVGICESADSSGFVCIEGNANSSGSRDGGGVQRVSRSLSSVRSIVRLS